MKKIMLAAFVLSFIFLTLSSADSNEWEIKIGVRTEKYRDSYNFIGVSKDSSLFYDGKDILEPPASSAGLWLYIPHLGWPFNPGRYATDYRPPIMNEESYDFIVETGNNTRITLFWSGMANTPAKYRFMLLLEDSGLALDMRESNRYTFDCNPGDKMSIRIQVKNEESPSIPIPVIKN